MNKNKVLFILLLCILIFIPKNLIHAKEITNSKAYQSKQDLTENEKNAALNLCSELLTRQFNSLITGNNVKTEDIFYESDSTNLYKQFLKWRIEQSQIMQTTWSDYKILFLNVDYNKEADNILVNGNFNLKYLYSNGLNGGQDDINFKATIKIVDNDYLISSINLDEVMFKEFTMLLDYEEAIDLDITNNIIKNINTDKIQDAVNKMLIQLESTSELIPEEPNQVQAPPMKTKANSYSYNKTTGVSYANKYVKSRNSCFYSANGVGGDCTNFVSQCIWASYGGWKPGDSVTTMTNNINNRVRMMPSTSLSNWFGHKNGGGTPWESVEGLWNFSTSNSGKGPRANGSNNNAVYKNLVAFAISSGDVLQVKKSGNSKYGHSVYVIYSNPLSSDGYHNITVAQHSSNTTRSLADLISGWGGTNCYMRKLTFTSAQFDK